MKIAKYKYKPEVYDVLS